MNTMRGLMCLMLIVGCALLTGCAKNSKEASNATAMASSAAATTGNLYSSLGGTNGVTALANSFGAKLAVNPTVSKVLDAASIDAVKGGLTNSIMAISGMAIPSGGQDLAAALSGKGLDPTALAGVGQSLMDAGTEQNLKPEQMASLAGLMDQVKKSVK